MCDSIFCTNCGYKYTIEEIKKKIFVCPKCQSEQHTVNIKLEENLNMTIHDNIKGKEIDHSFPSKEKVRKEFISGFEKRKCDGKIMEKNRVIDRDNDNYEEIVKDPATGETVHKWGFLKK